MYSEALAIVDRNTVNLMIDELKKQVAEKDNALKEKEAENEALLKYIDKLEAQLANSK